MLWNRNTKVSEFESVRRLGLIGLGIQGSEHLRACQVLSETGKVHLAAVCDANAARLNDAADATGARTFSTPTELLASGCVDAVILAVPNQYHFALCSKALQHGIHCLKEKPLALTIEQGVELASLAERSNLVLTTAQQRAFAPMFQVAKAWTREIGPIKFFDYRFNLAPKHTAPSWYYDKSVGGGSWYGLGWHGCWALHHLVGKPSKVSMAPISLDRSDADNACVMHAELLDGQCTGRILVNAANPLKEESIFVQGESGSVLADRNGLTLYESNGKVRRHRTLSPKGKRLSYERQIKSFLKSIDRCAAPTVSLDVLLTHSAAFASAANSGEAVDIERFQFQHTSSSQTQGTTS